MKMSHIQARTPQPPPPQKKKKCCAAEMSIYVSVG